MSGSARTRSEQSCNARGRRNESGQRVRCQGRKRRAQHPRAAWPLGLKVTRSGCGGSEPAGAVAIGEPSRDARQQSCTVTLSALASHSSGSSRSAGGDHRQRRQGQPRGSDQGQTLGDDITVTTNGAALYVSAAHPRMGMSHNCHSFGIIKVKYRLRRRAECPERRLSKPYPRRLRE